MASLDDLILAGIQEQKVLDPTNFSSETELSFYDFPALLKIVLSVDESLPSLDLEACASHIVRNHSLVNLLKTAYKQKSFSNLVEEPLIRVLANLIEDSIMGSSPLVKSDRNTSFQVAFQIPYQGNLPRHFIDVLNMYSRQSKGASKLYNKSISIIQSSGMGKSRLVQEVADQVFTIPANLREKLGEGMKAYPPPDEKLRSYFEKHEHKSDDLLQAEYSILLKHIFSQAARIADLLKDREGSLASTWADYLKPGANDEKVGMGRQKFYTEAVNEAYKVGILKLYVFSPTTENLLQEISGISQRVGQNSVLKEEIRLVDLFREMHMGARAMVNVVKSKGSDEASLPVDSVEASALEDYDETSASEDSDGTSVSEDSDEANVPEDHDETSASEGSDGTNACIVYFDEAHNLTKPPQIIEGIRYRNPYHNLGMVLSNLRDLPIFFIFLSTNTHLQQFAPPASYHPSIRVSQGRSLIPPFTELSFDVFMTEMFAELQKSEKASSLANACTTEVMSSMGRPLWFAHHNQWKNQDQSAGQRVNHVLEFAGEKLTAQDTPKRISQSKLAALSVRIGITFESTTRASRKMESRQIESHMRVVYAIPEHREYMRTGSPSEPVLAEAAAEYLNRNDGIAVVGPRILSRNCQRGFLARGERGELCGRLLMTIAHDVAMPRTATGNIKPFPHDPRVQFHRPIPVLAFLRALFAAEHHDTVLKATPITDLDGKPTLEAAFKNAFVCFSHFALAADSAMLEAESLRTALFRGMAMQAKDNQASIDAVIPVHMGSITSPITTETTSAINLQFKNRKRPLPCSVDRNITVPDPKQPVISIVLEFGGQSELPLVEVHHWNFPETRSHKSIPHYDDNHYSLVARGCGPETYGVIPEKAKKSYGIILASGALKDDFPRAKIKTSWELVEELKPDFFSVKCRAQWVRWNPDSKKPAGSPALPHSKGNLREAMLLASDQGLKTNDTKGLESGQKTGPHVSGAMSKKRSPALSQEEGPIAGSSQTITCPSPQVDSDPSQTITRSPPPSHPLSPVEDKSRRHLGDPSPAPFGRVMRKGGKVSLKGHPLTRHVSIGSGTTSTFTRQVSNPKTTRTADPFAHRSIRSASKKWSAQHAPSSVGRRIPIPGEDFGVTATGERFRLTNSFAALTDTESDDDILLARKCTVSITPPLGSGPSNKREPSPNMAPRDDGPRKRNLSREDSGSGMDYAEGFSQRSFSLKQKRK
ncbi:hypothetical protein FRC11_007674 [Ceratobasidium sp. 423]|nr:hypothetical protein FRC11_007674 [Ceratobasidium sp. 423]